jgi:hypothetical protein
VKVATFKDGLLKSRAAKLVLGAAATAAIASTALGGSPATAATHLSRGPAVVPTSDIVGTGLITCAKATGEVGYTPDSIAGGTTPFEVSIWFDATGCTPQAGTTATPVPKSVIGSMSFQAGPGCPIGGTLGTGNLNLTYNYPGVPNPMIDPSVVVNATVTNGPPITPFWTITGSVVGSYPTPAGGPGVSISLKPNLIGSESCRTGLSSEYIARSNGPLTNI